MTSYSFGGEAAAVGLHVLSFVSSLWLVLKLFRLPRPCRNRPLPRQLLTLALADCGFHASHTARGILRVLSIANCSGQERLMQRLMHWIMIFVHVGDDACLLFEISLALLFLLQCIGSVKAISMLKNSPLVVLPMSVFLSLLEPPSHKYGDACRFPFYVYLSYPILTLASFSICVVSLGFGVATLQRGQAPDIVRKRALQRTMAYVLNAVITELPVALSVALYYRTGTGYSTFALCCQACNGALNAAAFFGQSRYAAKSIDQVDHKDNKQSFVVKFEDAPEADVALPSPPPPDREPSGRV